MPTQFKSIALAQMEEAFAVALAALGAVNVKVTIKGARDVSDGTDALIGQERWEVSLAIAMPTLTKGSPSH